MKNTTQNTIKVINDKPCPLVDKELKTVNETCDFCTACNEFVYDFDKLAPEELLATYIANKGVICIKKTEKKSSLTSTATKKNITQTTKLKYWLMSFLALFGMSSCSFFSEEERSEVILTEEVVYHGRSLHLRTLWDSLRHDLNSIKEIGLSVEEEDIRANYFKNIMQKAGDTIEMRTWIDSINTKYN